MRRTGLGEARCLMFFVLIEARLGIFFSRSRFLLTDTLGSRGALTLARDFPGFRVFLEDETAGGLAIGAVPA